MNIPKIVTSAALFVGLILLPTSAAQVGKVSYSGQPEALNGKTIDVPVGSVAMSEEVHVDIPSELMNGGSVDANPSIMFVLDNSGSMWYKNLEMDKSAYRFKVTSRLIDSIYAKNPNAEIGISVFGEDLYFKKSDDAIFAKYNTSDDAYLPLLQLNKTYTSTKAGTTDGRSILKYYMKTRDTVGSSYESDASGKISSIKNWSWTTLNYVSSTGSGTNITAGFEGAKMAFKAAHNDKKNQYVIFISDGEATPGAGSDRFEDGTNVPTTFTIFFSKNGSIPPSLNTMNTNIAKNYPKTKAWSYKNNTETDLMNFVMKNIVSVITKSTEANVTKIKIQDDTSATWDKTSKTVKLGEMKPLSGVLTPFNYEISYRVEHRIQVNGKDSIQDTSKTYKTDFKVAIKSGITKPADSLKIEYWDRTLGMNVGGSAASKLSAVNPTAQLLFEKKPIDVNYDYTNVEITVKSLKKGDTEKYTLDKNGNLFTKDFRTDFSGKQVNNDGTVQVAINDELIASFVNPKLPLDTISFKIPYEAGAILKLEKSTWFDSNADGFVDSMNIDFTNKIALTADQTKELADRIVLAPDRRFEIDKSSIKWNAGTLAIRVKENNSTPRTSINDGDTVSLGEGTLNSGGITNQSSVKAIDSLAPVILDGSVILNDESGTDNDRLTVRYSESVNSATAADQYLDFRRGTTNYVVKLIPDQTNNETVVYKVSSLPNGYFMANGDWVRINASKGLIKDNGGKVQNNPKNIEREIRVSSSFALTKAAYFDINADGFIDSIAVNFSAGEGSAIKANDLERLINLPSDRKFTQDSSWVNGSVFGMRVTQNGTTPNTAVTETDSISIRSGTLSDGTKIDEKTIAVIDMMAPVILADGAVLNDLSGINNDKLTVRFSEPVSFTDSKGRYFDFRRGSTSNKYTAELKNESINGSEATFSLTATPSMTMMNNDSLRIGIANLVKDAVGNVQKKTTNVERTLRVTTSVAISSAAMFDKSGDGLIDLITIDFAAGEGVELNRDELRRLIDLPASRHLEIDSALVAGKKLSLYVKENSSTPVTSVSSSDEITLRAGTVGSANVEQNQTIVPADMMAPVLVRDGTTLYDYPGGGDTLVTRFSEPVQAEKASKKFFALRSNKTPYDAWLTPTKFDGNSVSWYVDYSKPSMKDGDSLKVSEGFIKDTSGNVQSNRDNREERINVVVSIDVANAHYFDKNGDGLIDSIVVGVNAGEGTSINPDDLRAKLTLPAFRNFRTNSTEFKGSNLIINVTEERTVPNTAITSEDIIQVASGTIGSAVIGTSKSITPVDHVAPVILPDGAIYRDADDSRKDSLTIQFSESLPKVSSSGKHFVFSRGNATYTMSLSPVDQRDNVITFEVNSSEETPLFGDSLRIEPGYGDMVQAMIRDNANNFQTNPLNVKRLLQVVTSVEPTRAVWFDRNADGFIDEINVDLKAGAVVFTKPASDLAAMISLPADRKFITESSAFNKKTLILKVKEGSNLPNTATLSTDKIGITAGSSTIQVIGSASLSPIDSVAPVIMPEGAVLEDSLSGKDYLSVTYSEPVTVTSQAIHNFKLDLSDYQMDLKLESQKGNSVRYSVISSTRPEDESGNDSIWINSLALLTDLNGIPQVNPKNIRRPMDVKLFVNPFSIVINAVNPYRIGVTPVPANLALPEFNLDPLTVGTGSAGLIIQAQAIQVGTTIALPRIALEGELVIYDPLGNVVKKSTDMIFIPESQSLFFVWNGHNENDRLVGSGMYSARVMVRAATANREYTNQFGKTLLLGIQTIPPVQ